jgi:hypothetical protein
MKELLLGEEAWPPGMGEPLRVILRGIIAHVRGMPEILGLAAGGSFITGLMDEFSDLDLILAAAPPSFSRVMDSRKAIARSMGPLLAAFTGEHVGEPRLLICLYGPPPVHVDLKFLTPEMLGSRVEDPVILWDRDGEIGGALQRASAAYPLPSLQWIEDRFWAWVHYVCAKIGRGELFEVLDCLAFLRARVLGPLAMLGTSARPVGVRRIEQSVPGFASLLESTVSRYDARDMLRALNAAIRLYRDLRGAAETAPDRSAGAEAAAMDYLRMVSERITDGRG